MKATTLVVCLIVLNSCIFLSLINAQDESIENNVQSVNQERETQSSSTPQDTSTKRFGKRTPRAASKNPRIVDRHNFLKQVNPVVKATTMANLIAAELKQGLKFSHSKDSVSPVNGMSHHVFFDQLAQSSSLKVAGCGFSYHESKNGQIKTMDNLLNITTVDWQYPLDHDEKAAIITVLNFYDPHMRESLDIACEMLVFPSSYCNPDLSREAFDGVGTVGFLCQVSPVNDIYYLSAMDLSEYCPPRTNNQTASATTQYDGNRNISTLSHGGTHFLEDTNRTSTVVDCAHGNCSTVINKISDQNDSWVSTNEKISTQVQWAVSQVLDYFKIVWGRNGLDGHGGPASILSEDGVTNLVGHKIHYGVNQTYAMWTGSDFVYGDGDGVTYGPMVSLDIVAHEMSHAIVEYDCNLDYSYQSGALRESFGDIVAAVLDYWTYGESNKTWKIGEDVYTPGKAGDAIRYMNEPSLADDKNFTLNDDPDHVSEMYNGTLDNGGVHVNSGIPNKVFYLLAKGGNHSNGGPKMTGIGIDAAFAIWYRAFTVYFSSNTDFFGARTAMNHAAMDLYGQAFNYWELQTAWGLCGVGVIPVPTSNLIVNGGFEGDTTGWLVSGAGAVFNRVASDKHSGYGDMRLGTDNGVTGVVGQTFTIPSNAAVANLTFWVWTTTSDSYTQARDFVWVETVNASNNYIFNQELIIANIDYTAGYVQKVINMLPYVGIPNIRIQWRVYCDSNAPTTFRLDDVALTIVQY